MIITFCGHSRISKDVKDKTKKERIFAPLIFISSTMTRSVNSCRRQFMKAVPSIHAILIAICCIKVACFSTVKCFKFLFVDNACQLRYDILRMDTTRCDLKA